jgi:hypothetical protein
MPSLITQGYLEPQLQVPEISQHPRISGVRESLRFAISDVLCIANELGLSIDHHGVSRYLIF